MNAPIPLRPDRDALREAAMRSLVRAVIDTARNTNERIAKSAWPDDRTTQLITRAATTQMTIADSQSFQTVALAFVASLAPVSAAAQVIARSLQLNFNGAAQISVPSLTMPYAEWTGEGGVIPVTQGVSTPGTVLSPTKLTVITALANDLIRSSNAETMVRQVLLENAGPSLDLAMFSADPAVPEVRPAGILNGITPVPPSSATSPFDAMVSDISSLAAWLAPASGGSEPVLIASPAQFVPLGMNVRNPYSVLMSAALPAGTVIGVVPAALATVVEVPRIETSPGATLHMDTAPTNVSAPGSPPHVAAPTISMYQTDSVSLRFILNATWMLRSPSGVAYTENVAW